MAPRGHSPHPQHAGPVVESRDGARSHATDDPWSALAPLLDMLADRVADRLRPTLAPAPSAEPWLTTAEVAERLGVGVNAARAAAARAVTKGLVVPQRVGRTLRYDPASVDVIRKAELTGGAR